jgi:2-methylaconitate cis-trans-isomerase PrpF
MTQRKLRAVFMRGGTSKGLVFRQADLPPSREDWAPIFTAAMGSPDPNGRQLDGMGGGVSSVSKVCVVGPATHPEADVDFTFVQVLVTENVADYGSNCGNMSSAIGPFAIEEGLISGPHDGEAVVRIHNTNTGKVVVSRFRMENGEAAVEGDLVLDGVAGSGAPIRLDFTEPGGSRTGQILPTGNAIDRLDLGEFGSIEASLIDVALPVVVVRADDLGLSGFELPADLDAQPDILAKLEAIRRAASVRMGLTADPTAAAALGSVPKVGFVAAAGEYRTLSGRAVAAQDMDLAVRMVSMGQPHRATPLTGALCLAAACRIPGTIPYAMTRHGEGALRLGHPSGVVQVDAAVSESDGQPHVAHATVYRTARRLFEGNVFYRG